MLVMILFHQLVNCEASTLDVSRELSPEIELRHEDT